MCCAKNVGQPTIGIQLVWCVVSNTSANIRSKSDVWWPQLSPVWHEVSVCADCSRWYFVCQLAAVNEDRHDSFKWIWIDAKTSHSTDAAGVIGWSDLHANPVDRVFSLHAQHPAYPQSAYILSHFKIPLMVLNGIPTSACWVGFCLH